MPVENISTYRDNKKLICEPYAKNKEKKNNIAEGNKYEIFIYDELKKNEDLIDVSRDIGLLNGKARYKLQI